VFSLALALLAERYSDKLGHWLWVILALSGTVFLWAWGIFGRFGNAWSAFWKEAEVIEQEIVRPHENKTKKTVADNLLTGDPSVYVSFVLGKGESRWSGGSTVKDTEVHVECASGTRDALNVQVKMGPLREGQVLFPLIPLVRSGTTEKVTAIITDKNGKDVAPFKVRDIDLALEAEWKSYNDLGKLDLEVPCYVDYEDSLQTKFRADATILYEIWNKKITVTKYQFKRLRSKRQSA